MKMVPDQLEFGLMKIKLCWIRSSTEDCNMPRFPLAQAPNVWCPSGGAKTSCSGNEQMQWECSKILGPANNEVRSPRTVLVWCSTRERETVDLNE